MPDAAPAPDPLADSDSWPAVNVPRSHAPGVVWPAVPDWRQAVVLGLLHQFNQSQWWSPEDLWHWQRVQAGRLIAHAQKHVPFYHKRLKRVPVLRDGTVPEGAWRRIPFVTRDDLQERYDSLCSQAIPEGHGRVTAVHSSGSTGRPIKALRTQLSVLFWEAFTHRDHDWHGRDRNQTVAVMRHAGEGEDPYPEGTRARNWGKEPTAVYSTGPCVALNLNTPLDQQVEWLQRKEPAYLLSFPSNVERLARHCLETGARIPTLRQVQLIAEVVRPELRELVRAAWGAEVVDTYSSREAGYLALQCPDHEHLHVQSEGVIVEVLKDDGTPCGPGEIGRVVVTPLHNHAMPLIRYDIGDYAEVGEQCPCGRGLPVLRRVLGRAQTTFVLPDGSRRWTLLSSGEIRELLGIGPIRGYQFVQTTTDHVEARLVVERALTDDEEEQVRGWLRHKLQYPFAVTIAYHDELPLTAGGKFFDFLSEVSAS